MPITFTTKLSSTELRDWANEQRLFAFQQARMALRSTPAQLFSAGFNETTVEAVVSRIIRDAVEKIDIHLRKWERANPTS